MALAVAFFGLSLLCFGISNGYVISRGEGESLYEPPRVDLTTNGSSVTIYVRLCRYSVTNSSNFLFVNMTRYCYCLDESDDSCTYPGPTLEMMSDTTINVTVVNDLIGSPTVYGPSDTTYWNKYKDMDTTNIHVHGLHVSPAIDDILIKIQPRLLESDPKNYHSYLYNFSYHYPGTFWYHAHHHGSTTWQVNEGLHGAILMNNENDIVSDNYYENVLLFNWQYIVNESTCLTVSGDCGEESLTEFKLYPQFLFGNFNNFSDIITNYLSFLTATDEYYENNTADVNETASNVYSLYSLEEYYNISNVSLYIDYLSSFVSDYESLSDLLDALESLLFSAAAGGGGPPADDFSMCNLYCQFPVGQRSESQFVYDIETDIVYNKEKDESVSAENIKYFVNGQLSPIIDDMVVNHYRRLRFINSLSNFYLQMKFPDEYCDWHLIATDGVYINSAVYRNYNLSNDTHKSTYMVAPGGRADILVRCTEAGTYGIESVNDNSLDAQLNNFDRVRAGQLLFSIQVDETTGKYKSDDSDTMLPSSSDYTPKPQGSYIQDLSGLSESQVIDECPCNFNQTTYGDNCTFNFYLIEPSSSINHRPFTYTESNTYPYLSDSLTIIEYNKSYEFIIDNSGDLPVAHVFHVHISPFQVPQAIGNNGYIALPLTWWDTLGNQPANSADYIKMRTWTRDYYGLIITHCHLLQHEDKGMMGFFNILPNGEMVESNDCPNVDYTNVVDGQVPQTTDENDSDDLANRNRFGIALACVICVHIAVHAMGAF